MDPLPPANRTDASSRRRRLVLNLSLAWAVALLFLAFVWPTAYRHPPERKDVRISRLTGQAEIYHARSGEWRPAQRKRRNGSATAGGSPIGGGREERGGRDGSGDGETWRAEGDGPEEAGAKRKAGGDRWWYREGGGSGSGSPIGGSRGAEGGSGSRSGKESPIGGN
jgi:hypothetical protein